MHRGLLRFLITMASVWLTLCPPIAAQTTCDADDPDCRVVGEWQFGLALGVGARTNPLLDGKDIPLIVLPSISYYGENFFIDNLDVGYTLFDSPNWMINILVTPSYDRVFFERWDIGNILVDVSGTANAIVDTGNIPINDSLTEIKANELKTRKFSLLGGAELSAPLARGHFQLGLFHDLSDVHSGKEIRLAYSTPQSNSGWNGTLGLTWKDAKMTDYYYGIDRDEVVDNRALYQAESSLNPFIRLNWQQSKQGADHWRFGLEYQQLDPSIADSPIVDKDYVITVFIGKQYNF